MNDDEYGAERELADDARWKKIQLNTFTRWTNEQLKTSSMNVESLETDLSDGLILIRLGWFMCFCSKYNKFILVEVLSHQKLPKHNHRPNFRSQKLENVSLALQFLENHEKIRIVNIGNYFVFITFVTNCMFSDSSDIVDQRVKLILGLIWTLILHYSISMPMWDNHDDHQNGIGSGGSNSSKDDTIKETPKQRLMSWIRSKLPVDVPVTNFTSDWNDGIAIGALVDAVAPGFNLFNDN
jgi:filamin